MGNPRILCYGDSNTYGFNAENGGRFPRESRWPGVLREEGDWCVIEEGQNNRTIFSIPSADPVMNGTDWFPSVLDRHLPVDLVILFLGINDLFYFPDKTPGKLPAGRLNWGRWPGRRHTAGG